VRTDVKEQPSPYWGTWVGKSAIAEVYFANVQKKVSRILFNKRCYIRPSSLVAGTKYRGQFEKIMKAMMNELEKMMTSFFSLMKFTYYC
jgi:ATP-dependent Clp protease ATP-binding subunit ClpA